MPTVHVIGKSKIAIFFHDTDRHREPHFHVLMPEGRAAVAIADRRILAADVPAREIGHALSWAERNVATLVDSWNRCNPHRPFQSGG